MNIVFRVDASIEMGIGHLMRCLTLADALEVEGAQCHFVCREHPGNLIPQIVSRGHQVHPLPLCQTIYRADEAQADKSQPAHAYWLGCDWLTDARQTLNCIGSLNAHWLIVDHYALDECWEKELRPVCKKIMVIDDLADRNHDCDLLLDQNLGRQAQDYKGLVTGCYLFLLGPKYALLRPEFGELREYSLNRRAKPKFKRLLISMGGVDKDNVTGNLLSELSQCTLPNDVFISVVMGASAPHIKRVCQQVRTMPWLTEVLIGINNMAQLMTDSDLAIGAAGSTTWERCCLGVPTITIILAENQREVANLLALKNIATLLNYQNISLLNEKLIKTISMYRELVKNSSLLVDGLGTQRLLDLLGA